MKQQPTVTRQQLQEAAALSDLLAQGMPLDAVPDKVLLQALTGFELALTLLNPYLPREGEILAQPLASMWDARQRLRQEALLRGLVQEEGEEGKGCSGGG